jgi:molecular chaperone DnaK (HSP70)
MIVGIDLGTSNCAVAFVDPAEGAKAVVRDFAVKQAVRPGEVSERPLLPSCLYLDEPWVIGEAARWLGTKASTKLVASAKSWLCHPGVDRQAPILPWGAPPEVPKISPVEASAKLLETLAAAWNERHPDAPRRSARQPGGRHHRARLVR